MKKIFLAVLLTAMMMFVAAPAVQAQAIPVIYYFTSDHVTNGAGTPPFGQLVLTQDGLNVDFAVTLYNGSKFVRTGAGDFMDFKFNAIDVDVTDISGSSLTAATGLFNGDGGGLFDFGVYFTDQRNGGGAGIAGPIEFTVANALIADFIDPSLITHNDKGQLFVADILSGQTGNTGLVDVSPTQVPEPMTLLLLGLGLVGVAGGRRMLKK